MPTLSQIAAEAAFDGTEEMEAIKHGYEENRRILIEGLPEAGLTDFLPADGAFYLYADVSQFHRATVSTSPSGCWKQAHVAATPGVDFDPFHGKNVRPLLLCALGRGNARGGDADRGLAGIGLVAALRKQNRPGFEPGRFLFHGLNRLLAAAEAA